MNVLAKMHAVVFEMSRLSTFVYEFFEGCLPNREQMCCGLSL